LELERHVRRLEERQMRPIVHSIERVQRLGLAPALGLADLQRRHERQAEEALVELPRLLRIAAPVRVVMQPFDHELSLARIFQIFTKGSSFMAAWKLYRASLIFGQALSFFMLPSQRATLGYFEKSQRITSPSVT